MKRFFLIFSFCFTYLNGWAFSPVHLPVPQVETLPNGLKVVWFVNNQLPLVDFSLLVQAGFRDDPVGKSGTAELVSVSLDRAVKGLNAQQFAREVELLGGVRYTAVDDDHFTVGIHGLSTDSHDLLKLLSKMTLEPEFPAEFVKKEQHRILDRWGHLPDSTDSLASVIYRWVATAGTSYGRGGFMGKKEFTTVGLGDVKKYYSTYFSPKNSVLTVVGRVNPNEVRQQILASFGGWQGEVPKRNYQSYTHPIARNSSHPSLLLVDRPGLTQVQVKIGFSAPVMQSEDHYPLTVANSILGEYFSSRLNTVVRDKLGLTYGISSGFNYFKEFAFFTISSATRPELVGKMVLKTQEVLKDMSLGNIKDEELSTAKNYLEGGFPLSVSTANSVAVRWLVGHMYGLNPNYLNEFIPSVQAVTLAQVNQAAQKHFKFDRMVIVIAGDAGEIRKSLLEAGIKSFKQVSVQDLM